MERSNEEKIKRGKSKKPLLIACCIAAVLILGAVCAWWLLVVENVSEELTIEAGAETVEADAFLLRDWDISASFVTDMSTIDMCKPGDYPIQLEYYGRVWNSVLRIRDTVSPDAVLCDLTVVSVRRPAPEDFIQEFRDATEVSVQYASEPDMSIAGDQIVTLLLTDEGGNTAELAGKLTVIMDTEGPVIEGVQSYTIYRGTTVDYQSAVTITDNEDEAPTLTIDDSAVDLTQGGEYEVIYTGRDISGNETVERATITVIVDETGPTIHGVNELSVSVGSTVSYRSGILVTDDYDDDPSLSVDSSAVDLKKAGSYEITYIARDEAGNETRVSTTVEVRERSADAVDEDEIYEAADELLAEIVTDGMSDYEKVKAIYNWLGSHYNYSGSSDKSDWLQAAYSMMTKKCGDCFGYYSLSKLFFDRLGIPNISVRKVKNYNGDSDHYWSLVSVDGGNSYYHFDATPRSGSGDNFCLVTDAFLDAYSARHYNSHNRDKSLYPATPTEGI